MKLREQKDLVRKIAQELGYDPDTSLEFIRETRHGETLGWPILKKAIRRAEDLFESNNRGIMVVATLDGLQFNLSFLEKLKSSRPDWPIYVCRGSRRVKILAARGTNYEETRRSRGWVLSIPEEADEFADYVSRVRSRNDCLGNSIREGLRAASERGVALGGRHPSSYQFAGIDRSKGGQATARKRRQDAEQRYGRWIDMILRWRANGNSLGQIAAKLAGMKATTTDGRAIGRMQIHRILKRASNRGSLSAIT